MANFLAVYDPVDQRRSEFQEKCAAEIAIFDNLKCGRLTVANYSVLWAVSNKAPIDRWSTENEGAVIFGDAIRPGSHQRLTARDLSKKWADTEKAQNHFYDGYYGAVKYSIESGLIVGGDILGLFPIYYYTNDKVVLVGSSPELFKYHDCFKPEICVEGLTGMLMTMHSIGGLTLWKNAYRMQPGHILSAQPAKKIEELRQYQLPFSDKYYGIPFKQQLNLTHKRMEQAVSRHAPAGQSYSLLFSGGLDTRMLAGYLKNRGNSVTAITLGKSRDMEMEIAKKVLKHLPFPHKTFNIAFNRYDDFARLTARWEHGLHGFNTIPGWSYNSIADDIEAPRMISGIHHDGIFSGYYLKFLALNSTSKDTFDKIFNWVCRWGLTTADLKELYSKPCHNTIMDSIYKKLQEKYLGLANSDYERNWSYELYNRGRFHHGGAIWKMSFGAWPVIPALDSSLLEMMAGLPCSTRANRHLQRSLVSTYFEDLARIPLDNNSYHPEALLPTWQSLLYEAVTQPKIINRVVNGIKFRRYGPHNQKLYYYRIYDINNAGWKKVRRLAEPARTYTSSLFDQKKLQLLLPPPDKELDKKIGDASGLKSLLGFFLWLQNNAKETKGV